MAENKTEEVEETTGETQATDETVGASNADTNETSETGGEAQATAGTEEKSESDSSILGGVLETVSSAVGSVAEAVVSGVENVVATVTGDDAASDDTERKHGKRAEKIGVVASDKMTKTVVVRVDRLVKHPIYRKYIRRKKKFMAHDDFGAAVGDKVRIVETRPMSARKRWRVAEIIQKAVK